MGSAFVAGITPDARGADGRHLFDFGLLDETSLVECRDLEVGEGELSADAVVGCEALVIASSRFRVSRATLQGADRLALIARLGVGYETIDLGACTDTGVAVTNSPDAVRRPMARVAIAFLLALTLKLPQKERALREGRWADGARDLGLGLDGHVLGIVGLGNIGAEIARLAAPFSVQLLACDPHVRWPPDREPAVELVGIDELLSRADTVVVSCPLNDSTRRLLNRERLAWMKPSAFLINIARGPIVDQDALVEMLGSGRLAGAALDVFDPEPIDPTHPLLALPNVIATPHAMGWTEDGSRTGGRSASRAVLAVASGRVPEHLVNPDVLERPAFLAKLEARSSDT